MKRILIIVLLAAYMASVSLFGATAARRITTTATLKDHAVSQQRDELSKWSTGRKSFTIVQDTGTTSAWEVDTLVLMETSVSQEGYEFLHAWAYVSSKSGSDSAWSGDSLVCRMQTTFNGSTWFTLTGVDDDTTQTTALTDVCQTVGYSRTASASTKYFGKAFRIIYINSGAVGQTTTAQSGTFVFDYGYDLRK